MKIGTKLSVSISLLVLVLFSWGGHLIIQKSSNFAVEQIIRQYRYLHETYRVFVEEMVYRNAEAESIDEEQLHQVTRFIGGLSQVAVYTETFDRLYASYIMPLDGEYVRGLVQMKDGYNIRALGETHRLDIVSPTSLANRELYVITSHNVSEVFAQKEEQYRRLFAFTMLLIAVAILCIWALSKRITSPLKELTTISERISAGAYQLRTNIRSNDEIGKLAKSFDEMATAIEDKVHSLEAAVHARDCFVANFSHEIRTPMTAIIGYADMLRSYEQKTETQIKAANYIYKESRRIADLSLKLMDLMALSDEHICIKPITTGKLKISELEDAVWQMSPAAVMADETLIHSVISNLYANAKKAKATEIMITGYAQGPKYRILISDNGCGIPEESMLLIKEPFFMADKSHARNDGSFGLGLTLCEKIANLHGTSLVIQSKLNVGTSISFELQLCENNNSPFTARG